MKVKFRIIGGKNLHTYYIAYSIKNIMGGFMYGDWYEVWAGDGGAFTDIIDAEKTICTLKKKLSHTDEIYKEYVEEV